MAERHEMSPLPPGWECKYDHRTGRYYYINYFSKTTTWEDPRLRYLQLAQAPPPQVPTSSSLLESIPLQDLTNIRPSSIPGRAFTPLGTPYSSPTRAAETALGGNDLEQSVMKISAMFPTVSDTHIRTLLLKYLKSVFPKAEETLLLDILASSDNNVQKATEKLIVMGFEKRDTPPPRLTLRRREEEQKEQERRTATPTPPPRMKSTEEKQKMKGRLQEKYPDIPERLITIALDSVDYDEDRAFQILGLMVQEEEKTKSTSESVSKISQEGEKTRSPSVKQPPKEETAATETSNLQISVSEEVAIKASPRKMSSDKGLTKRPKAKKDISKVSRGTSTTEDKEYKSPYVTKPCGPDRSLCKGSNDALLLPDYVAWNGPNPDLLQKSHKSIAKGSDKSLLQERSYNAKGPNSELRKGPMSGLTRGSIYSQMSDGKIEESRGK